mmetsp:Transcript_118203/g.341738  ORF Transcript_118203/g.341738 Transcript_118203/m.341738 type:complete len:217 (-) Transcript_118203:464-1114(-)
MPRQPRCRRRFLAAKALRPSLWGQHRQHRPRGQNAAIGCKALTVCTELGRLQSQPVVASSKNCDTGREHGQGCDAGGFPRPYERRSASAACPCCGRAWRHGTEEDRDPRIAARQLLQHHVRRSNRAMHLAPDAQAPCLAKRPPQKSHSIVKVCAANAFVSAFKFSTSMISVRPKVTRRRRRPSPLRTVGLRRSNRSWSRAPSRPWAPAARKGRLLL